MTKWIETTGRSEEDAISAALFQLGLERDDVSVSVVERAKSGFLGFGSNPAKVRVSYEAPDEKAPAPVVEKKKPVEKKPVDRKPAAAKAVPTEKKSAPVVVETRTVEQNAPVEKKKPFTVIAEGEKVDQIKEFLTGLMQHMDVEATPVVAYGREGGFEVTLEGESLGALIGRRGETLDAIQQLTNYAVNRGQSKRVRIHIDAENYRAKREEALEHLAVKVAGKVVKYRKNVTLEAMNAYERHVVHSALQDLKGISTYSTGVEPNRRTVVAYAPDNQ